MRVDVKTKNPIDKVTITNLNKELLPKFSTMFISENWYKLLIPCERDNIIDITVSGESIKHCLNSGCNTKEGYEIWLHGNLAEYFSRISECIAQDDLLLFKDLESKYLITESWNEKVEGDFIPNHVKQFFAKGEGPYWYHKADFFNLPYIEYNGPAVDTDLFLDADLTFIDNKFYGEGKCKSLQRLPVMPLKDIKDIKNSKLKDTMKQFGFGKILQMQYVELQPNSVIPVHKDDFTYEDGKHIISGPTQLYCVLSGSTEDIKFKFKNVGLLDVSKPIFINNHKFVHSLVYTGNKPRGVLLAYGISDLTNKKLF
jgi:hypothetical protein